MKKLLLALTALTLLAPHVLAAPGVLDIDFSKFHFTIPDAKWAMQINLDGFTLDKGELDEDGKARSSYFSSKDGRWGVGISGLMPSRKINAEEFRDFLFENATGDESIEISDWVTKDDKDAKILDYLVNKLDGETIRGKISHRVYDVPKGIVDVMIFKDDYSKSDDAQFDKIFKGIKLNKRYKQTSSDHLIFGSLFFSQENYSKAIKLYSKGVALEKRKPALDKDSWRVLVDGLGMAYGITKKYPQAQKTFDYGLSVDPEYPMFHYNLACLYAETGRVDKALASLEKTYEFRENMIEGEKFSDIRKDSSFKTLLGNKNFQAIAKKFDGIRK